MTAEATPWRALVGEMRARRTALARTAPDLFPETVPGAPATGDRVAAAEQRLGFPLDAQHLAVLREVDGWPDVFAYGDLLAVDELGAGTRWDRGWTAINAFYDDGAPPGFPAREGIYPVHVCERAVFVVDRSGPVTDGGHPVFWLSDELLGAWPNTAAYWSAGLAMLDRLRSRLGRQAD